MFKSLLTGCAALAISVSTGFGAVAVFEDFRTADGTPDLEQYMNGGSPAVSPYMTIVPGNSPGVQFDPNTNTSYNGEGVLDMHHTGTSSNASNLSVSYNYGQIQPDAVSKKVYLSVDLKPGDVSSGNLFRFFWERGNAAVIAQVYCSPQGFQVRGNDGLAIAGTSVGLPLNQWSRVVVEATYAGAPADPSSLKIYLNGAFLGSKTYAAGPLAGTGGSSSPAVWQFQKDSRTDLPEDTHLFADLMTTSDTPIPLTIPEPTALVLLGLGSVLMVSKRRRHGVTA